MKLTDDVVSKLKLAPGKGDRIVFDDRRPGLGVRLRTGGDKSWVVQYRFGSKQRRFNLGSVNGTTTTKARAYAEDIFVQVRRGIDPQAEKRRAHSKAADTFEHLAGRFLEDAQKRLRPRSYIEVARHIEKYWAPLNDDAIQDINRKTVAATLSKLASKNGPVASNRARASLSALFSWAMGEGLAEANPVIGTNKGEERTRDRVLSDAELTGIWRACRDNDYGRIVRLLILTGQRREEVGGIAEAELDLEKRFWTLPAERSKNKRPHEVPLSDAAMAILSAVPRRQGRSLLFGETADKPFQGWSRARISLDERLAKVRSKDARKKTTDPPRWHLHDIRRTVATRMADLGVLPHVIEAVLNHQSGSKGGIAGIYNRATYQQEKRQALDMWAAHVEALASGKAGKIVPLRRA